MRFLHIIIICLQLIGFVTQTYANSSAKSYYGKIGIQDAEFILSWEADGNVFGHYVTLKGEEVIRYALSGNNKVQGKLELNEYTGSELTAQIQLQKSAQGGKIVWSGTMKNTDGRSFPVSFSRNASKPAPAPKDIQLPIKSTHDLDNLPEFSEEDINTQFVSFPATMISTTVSHNGIASVILQLHTATDGDPSEDIPAKYRVVPNPSQITVSSKKLNQLLARNINYVSIASTGRYKQKIVNVTISDDIFATEAHRLASGKTQLTAFNPKTRDTFTVALDNFGDFGPGGAREWKVGESDEEFYRIWQPSTSSWKGKPYLYFGDGGGSLYFGDAGWCLGGNPAGPDGADYSYLETNSSRGEFD
jgi:hypothetical protein